MVQTFIKLSSLSGYVHYWKRRRRSY